MKPERIKIQYEFLKENPTASLVSCFHDSLSHDGKVVLEVNKPELSYGNQGIYEWKSLIHNLFIPLKLTYHKSFDLFSATFFFFRKEDSIKIGLFDKRMNPRDKQDWEFSLRMFEIGKFLHVPISLQYFREESVETRKYKNKDVTQLYTMIQEQKFFSILWERYGKNIPENFNTLYIIVLHLYFYTSLFLHFLHENIVKR